MTENKAVETTGGATRQKVALITGVTGQDGAYLASYLLKKNYIVHGIKRRSSLFNTQRVDHLYQDLHEDNVKFFLHYGDVTDGNSITNIVSRTQPDEVYNLAAMSHVKVSFLQPEYTANTDATGALRVLEAIRTSGLGKTTKFYQASSSELYGKVQATPQNEDTPFYPRSPYAVAKLYAHWITINYREAYEMFACSGILFNHESPLRGETFVTRKITRGLARIVLGLQEIVYLGNLNACRDWGHAKDYVRAMHLILQAPEPEDYVIATGESRSVRDFIRAACNTIGVTVEFTGKDLDEVTVITEIDKDKFSQFIPQGPTHLKIGQVITRVSPRYFRPAEVDHLLGDATKARTKLGWQPEYPFPELVADMMLSDIGVLQGGKLKPVTSHNHV